MLRIFLFVAAVVVIYFGGFVYEEVGPVFYGLIIAIIASTPLLLKISFWKKILLMVPLLVLRVIGKLFLVVFGKNALSKVLAKYGLLERRFNRITETFAQSRSNGLARWKSFNRSVQAYLLLIFFPVALVIFILALIIKIVRLRFLQFIIEKLMQKILLKWTSKASTKFADSNLPGSKLLGSKVKGAVGDDAEQTATQKNTPLKSGTHQNVESRKDQ